MRAFAAATLGMAAVLALAGCGEREQVITAKKVGVPAFEGTGVASYSANGWKPGNEASWKEQIHGRMRNQNEYTRVGSN